MKRGQHFKITMQPSTGRPPLRGSVELVLALHESGTPPPALQAPQPKVLDKKPVALLAKAS